MQELLIIRMSSDQIRIQFLSQIILVGRALLLQLVADDGLQLSSISSKTSYSLQLLFSIHHHEAI